MRGRLAFGHPRSGAEKPITPRSSRSSTKSPVGWWSRTGRLRTAPLSAPTAGRQGERRLRLPSGWVIELNSLHLGSLLFCTLQCLAGERAEAWPPGRRPAGVVWYEATCLGCGEGGCWALLAKNVGFVQRGWTKVAAPCAVALGRGGRGGQARPGRTANRHPPGRPALGTGVRRWCKQAFFGGGGHRAPAAVSTRGQLQAQGP